MKNALYRFLTFGTEHNEIIALRTVMMANAFLVISIITFSIFSYVNFTIFNTPVLGMIDAVAAAVSLIALADLRFNKAIDRAVLIGAANFFLFYITFAHTNQNSDFGLIWTIFFPIFVITLMGHKKGLLITIFFYTVLFIMSFRGIGVWDDGLWNLRSALRFCTASIVLTYVVYVYESALNRSNIELSLIRRKEAKYLEELHRLSVTDPLTSLYNRRRMNDLLHEQINFSKRYQISFSLIMFDIDDFKQINDRYGHNSGDQVLVNIAAVLTKFLRSTDYSARWGGEEFLILLPQTPLSQALSTAEKLRKEIEGETHPCPACVTCSFGVAQYDGTSEETDIIEHADNALYAAKKNGKNCVIPYESAR